MAVLFIADSSYSEEPKKVLCELEGNYSITYDDFRRNYFNEAVEIANNTEYGLSAGVWTEKGSKILWTADRLEAGVVWANTFNKFDPASPFGGYKESGFGREGGRHGLLSYLKEFS